jgi:hypothetical protein
MLKLLCETGKSEVIVGIEPTGTTRTINPLRKKQSIVVLSGKLLKILHSICVKQVKFDGSKMKADISCLQEAV